MTKCRKAKRLALCLLAALLLLACLPGLLPAARAAQTVKVYVDGRLVTWTDAKPYINADDRTMVPLRAVAEAMGLDVTWLGEYRTARFTGRRTAETGEAYDISVYFQVDSTDLEVCCMPAGSGNMQMLHSGMDTFPVETGGRTYAPIRYLAESFGYQVRWAGAENAAYLTSSPLPQMIEMPTQENLMDGTYPVYVYRNLMREKDGKVWVYGEVQNYMTFMDSQIQALKVGDLLSLEGYRDNPYYADVITVEKLEKGRDGEIWINDWICLERSGDGVPERDGDGAYLTEVPAGCWLLRGANGMLLTYTEKRALLCFDADTAVYDDMSAYGYGTGMPHQRLNDVRDYFEGKWMGLERMYMTVRGGKLTEVNIYYHP